MLQGRARESHAGLQLHDLRLRTNGDRENVHDGGQRRGTGEHHQMGVIPRSFQQIFETIRGAGAGVEYLVRVSMIELYNEKIK